MAEGEALRGRAPPRPRGRAGRRRGARSASGGRPRPRAARARSRLISALVRAAQRLDPADDAGAAAEGDDGDALGRAGVEQRAAPRRRRRAPRPRRGPSLEARRRASAPGRRSRGRCAWRSRSSSAVEDRVGADRVDQRRRQRLAPRAARSRSSCARQRPRLELADPLAQDRQRRSRRAPARSHRVAPPPPLRVAARRRLTLSASLDPVERLVEDRALAAAHHRRAQPRHARAASAPRRAPTCGALPAPRAARSRPASCAGAWRTACPPAAAPRRSARSRPS